MGKPTFPQTEHFYRLVEAGVVTAENFQAFLENPTRFFDEAGYPVSINYGQTLEQMIAAGHYGWKNDDINPKNFPLTGSGTADVKLRLVHLNRVATTKEIEDHLEALNLRSATLPEQLAFGAKHPDKQKQFPIVALGSSWVNSDGDRRVPYLYEGDDRRRLLGLCWDGPGRPWREDFRFLAVSK